MLALSTAFHVAPKPRVLFFHSPSKSRSSTPTLTCKSALALLPYTVLSARMT
jgi:hypothetical protein